MEHGFVKAYWGPDSQMREDCVNADLPWPIHEDDEGIGDGGPRCLFVDYGLKVGRDPYLSEAGLGSVFEPWFWNVAYLGFGIPRLRVESAGGYFIFPMASFPTALLLFAIIRVVQRRSQRPGFCARCGYNLTGLTSGRCPECGTPVRNAQPERA